MAIASGAEAERLERWKTKQAVAWSVMASTMPRLSLLLISVSLWTGTQIAQDTADLVLLGDRLEALPELRPARRTMAKIRQNLFWPLVTT